MTSKQASNPRGSRKRAFYALIPGLFALAMVALMLSVPLGQMATGTASPQVLATTSSEPNPTMNGNVTWSTFYSGWSPLEYNNSIRNTTLNASLSTFYQNPISINPADINAPGYLTQDKVGGAIWTNSTQWKSGAAPSGGATETTHYWGNGVSITLNASDATGGTGYQIGQYVQYTSLPSANLQYDYLTIAGEISATNPITTAGGFFALYNATGYYTTIDNVNGTPQEYTGTYSYQAGTVFYMTAPISDFGSIFSTQNNTGIRIGIGIQIPQTTTASTYNITLSGLAISSAPYYLGTKEISGAQEQQAISSASELTLKAFSPTFSWDSITNNGYTVAVSQNVSQALNSTATTTSVSSGNYIEQGIYSGNLYLPTAPGLTYGGFNITEKLNVPGSQFQALSFNGVSYLNEVSSKNGSYVLSISGVNPNQKSSFLAIVDYTNSQWNGISNAPGFLSDPLGFLDYYWELLLVGILGAVGIGGAASSKGKTAADKERVRK